MRSGRPGCPGTRPQTVLGYFRGIATTKFLCALFFAYRFFFSLVRYMVKEQNRWKQTTKKAKFAPHFGTLSGGPLYYKAGLKSVEPKVRLQGTVTAHFALIALVVWQYCQGSFLCTQSTVSRAFPLIALIALGAFFHSTPGSAHKMRLLAKMSAAEILSKKLRISRLIPSKRLSLSLFPGHFESSKSLKISEKKNSQGVVFRNNFVSEGTLWHEAFTKTFPENYFRNFEGVCFLKLSRKKERHFQGITREIRNSCRQSFF